MRRALVVADAVPVRALLRDDAALRAQRLADRDPRLEPVHAVELGAGTGDDTALVHDRRHRQAVPAADLEVVRVVRGRDLHRSGAERRVDVVVGEDRDAAADQRKLDLAADEVPVPLVVRVHDDGGVAQHRLDPRGGDDDRVVPIAVADRDQLAVDLLVLHLDVGEHAAQRGRPVDHPLGAVDQAVVVQPLEHGADGAVAALVHREALTRPVDALAEPAHLREDRAAVLGLPLPRALEERLATQLAAAGALGDQRLLHQRMHGDRGVVHARQVQGVVTLHPPAADQQVDQRVLERVPDVQAAGDVRRRDDDRERRLVALRVGLEVAALDPPPVQPGLYLARDELGGQIGTRGGGAGHRPKSTSRVRQVCRTPRAPLLTRVARSCTASGAHGHGEFGVPVRGQDGRSTACSRSKPSTGARRRSRMAARSSSRTCPLVGSYTRHPSPSARSAST